MVKKICLDSSILIGLLSGNERVKRKIKDVQGTLVTTSISVFEIWFGRKEEELVFNLLNELEVFGFNKRAAKRAADILRELKDKGKVIGLKDLFIGAICIEEGLRLMTLNRKHFRRLKRFHLEII